MTTQHVPTPTDGPARVRAAGPSLRADSVCGIGYVFPRVVHTRTSTRPVAA